MIELKPFELNCPLSLFTRVELLSPNALRFFWSIKGGKPLQEMRALGSRKNDLWKKDVFEVFLHLQGLPGYYEINVSPVGDWNIYHLERYRAKLQEIDDISLTDVQCHFQPTKNESSFAIILESKLFQINPVEKAAITSVLEFGNQKYHFANKHGKNLDFHDIENHINLNLI